MSDWLVEALVVVGVIAALIVLPIVAIIQFDKWNMQGSCPAFANETGYKTRYVEYTYISYDCIAQKENGKWISTSKLRENE